MAKHLDPALAAEPEASTRWQGIAAELRADITSGRLAPGTRLPNESQLAQRFAVNRHTVRQAMQALAHEGHVLVRQGSGTYVRALVLDYALKRRTRLTENLAAEGASARRDLLGHEQAAAGEWAAPLGLAARSRVLLLHTRAVVRGRPIGLSTSAFPLPRCAAVLAGFERHRSISAALAGCGIADYTRARSTVSTRLPSPAEADALARAPAQPVLVVQYLNVDDQGRPVEAGRSLFAADAVQLSIDGAAFADEPGAR